MVFVLVDILSFVRTVLFCLLFFGGLQVGCTFSTLGTRCLYQPRLNSSLFLAKNEGWENVLLTISQSALKRDTTLSETNVFQEAANEKFLSTRTAYPVLRLRDS